MFRRELKRSFLAALAIGAALLGAMNEANAQGRPTTNPTYLPQALLPAVTIPVGGGTFPFQIQNESTGVIEIKGSPSGLVAKVEVTTERAAPGVTPNWTQIAVDQVGVTRVQSITGTGKYHFPIAGYAQYRLNVTALSSGATTVAEGGSLGDRTVSIVNFERGSFSYASLIGTGATNHFLVLAGSATKTVRVTHVECSGFATTANNVQITAEVDSAADTGDAGTAVTGTAHDQNIAAATAVVLKHTTSPTPGALVGLVRAGSLMLGNAATVNPSVLSWDFGKNPGEEEIVLRGVAQQFALNSSAAFGSGASVGCSISTTEE